MHFEANEEQVLGVFSYTTDGFSIVDSASATLVKWADILQINVFKTDQVVVDCITMELVLEEGVICVNEDIPGWENFISNCQKQFPSIPANWEIDITQPPFAANYRTLYQRN